MQFGARVGRMVAGRDRLLHALRGVIKKQPIAAFFGVALSLLSVSPPGLIRNLGSWTDFLIRHQVPLLTGTVCLLTLELLRRRSRFVARLEYIAPLEVEGIQDVLPHRIAQRGMGVLRDLSQLRRSRTHVFRIIVLTGKNTLHYLEYLVENFPFAADWEIRVLIFDPAAPAAEHLGDDAREDILAGCRRLAKIKEKAGKRRPNVKLSYRCHQTLPTIRGCLLDDDHCFFGFFKWVTDDGSWRLAEQNKRFVYATANTDDFSRDALDCFGSWYDYQWATGRDPDS